MKVGHISMGEIRRFVERPILDPEGMDEQWRLCVALCNAKPEIPDEHMIRFQLENHKIVGLEYQLLESTHE